MSVSVCESAPRNLRHLHFEVPKVLYLPRNLHFKASCLTKCCARHESCTSRFTRRRACYEICTSRFSQGAVSGTKSAHRGFHKVLRLPRNLHFEVRQVLHLLRNLHFEVHKVLRARTKSALQGPQSTAPATKAANEPRVQKSRFTAPVTKSERVEDHRHVLRLPRNLHFEVKPLRSLAPVTKSDHHVGTCATRTRSREAPAPATQISRASRNARRRLREARTHRK